MLAFSRRIFAALAVAMLASAPAYAQQAPVADAAAAPAGAYEIDARHSSVIARVPHQGFSYSIFRFNTVAAELTWDPADPTKNALSATVETGSIDTPVEGFAEELAGERFLNAAAFPTATFVSTAFRQTDAAHGEIEGDLTIKGVTRRVTFATTLIGAGPTQSSAKLGVHATTTINAGDFNLPPFITGQIELVIDAEFRKTS